MNKDDIKYLSFEGGGGKCIAYIGAIKAMEEKEILPVKKNGTVRYVTNSTQPIDTEIPANNIYGISGSSGGGLIAFFLALGLNAKEIEFLLNEPYDKKDNQLIKFFDYPVSYLSGILPSQLKIQYYRSVNQVRSGPPPFVWKPEKHEVSITEMPSNFQQFILSSSEGLIKSLARDVKRKAERLFEILFYYFGRETITSFSPSGAPVAPNVARNNLATKRFLLNLFLGRGIFSGFGVRDYLQEKMKKYLLTPQNIVRFKELFKISPKEGEITFEQFYALTGVNLIVTGTNVTLHKPEYFSKDFTPNFPVVEAIGVTTAFPLLYKPVVVKDINDFHNLYVDGGMLNNFPLHAFDYYYSNIDNIFDSMNLNYNKPINPNVLGFRLTSGHQKPAETKFRDAPEEGKLFKYIGDLINTFMYPSEEGQIRTPEEKEQTIELFSYGLQVADYNPKEEVKKKAIDEAYSKTNENISS